MTQQSRRKFVAHSPLARVVTSLPIRGSALAHRRTSSREAWTSSVLSPIVLQKSKVAPVQIFGENHKRKEVDDSHSLSRATEVAHEFGVRRCGPSNSYTNNAPAALRNLTTSAKRLLQHYLPKSGHRCLEPPCPVCADFVAKVGALCRCPSVIRLRATGFDLPALARSAQLSLYAMH